MGFNSEFKGLTENTCSESVNSESHKCTQNFVYTAYTARGHAAGGAVG